MKSNSVKVVVLGGGYAGIISALRLAGKTKQQQVQIAHKRYRKNHIIMKAKPVVSLLLAVA